MCEFKGTGRGEEIIAKNAVCFFGNLFLLYFTDVREDEGFVRGEIVYRIYFVANKSK